MNFVDCNLSSTEVRRRAQTLSGTGTDLVAGLVDRGRAPIVPHRFSFPRSPERRNRKQFLLPAVAIVLATSSSNSHCYQQ